MKKFDLGQTISIMANVGVIAGIVFLAIEVRQNNLQLAVQSENTLYELRERLQSNFVGNVGGIADLVVKERNGEALSQVELSRLESRRVQIIRTFEHMFLTDPDGARSYIGFMVVGFDTNAKMLETWERSVASGYYDPAFILFVQQYVIPLLGE
jgi:hypothetical protein